MCRGGKVVAAFKGGSADIESSQSRVDGYTKELQEKWGVKLCDSISEMCQQVDAVMLESVDGRPHAGGERAILAACLCTGSRVAAAANRQGK